MQVTKDGQGNIPTVPKKTYEYSYCLQRDKGPKNQENIKLKMRTTPNWTPNLDIGMDSDF